MKNLFTPEKYPCSIIVHFFIQFFLTKKNPAVSGSLLFYLPKTTASY